MKKFPISIKKSYAFDPPDFVNWLTRKPGYKIGQKAIEMVKSHRKFRLFCHFGSQKEIIGVNYEPNSIIIKEGVLNKSKCFSV